MPKAANEIPCAIKPLKCLMVCVRFPEDIGIGVERCMQEDGYTNRSLWMRDLVLGRLGGDGK